MTWYIFYPDRQTALVRFSAENDVAAVDRVRDFTFAGGVLMTSRFPSGVSIQDRCVHRFVDSSHRIRLRQGLEKGNRR